MKFLDIEGLRSIKPFDKLPVAAIMFIAYYTDRRSPFIRLDRETREKMARQVSGWDGAINDTIKECIELYKKLDWDPIDHVIDTVNNKMAIISAIIDKGGDDIERAIVLLDNLLNVRLKIEKIINEMSKDNKDTKGSNAKAIGSTRGSVEVPWLEKLRKS